MPRAELDGERGVGAVPPAGLGQQGTESGEIRVAEAQSLRKDGARPGRCLSRAGPQTKAWGGVFIPAASARAFPRGPERC